MTKDFKKALKVIDIPRKGLTGVYQGSRQTKGKFGPTNLYTIGTTDVWGCRALDEALSEFSPGTKVKVTYDGSEETPQGGKKYLVTVEGMGE